MKIVETEAPVILVPELPQQKVLFAQDLVYSKAHAYFGDRTSDGNYCLDNWIKTIKDFQTKNYKIVLPGHGDPTDSTVFPEIINYLEFVKAQLNAGLKGDDLINGIKNQYPSHVLPLTLIMSNYMLFEFKM
jgi:glyoxylase-like metal-dependent hydrolase (beta-lactamase superfamily II)